MIIATIVLIVISTDIFFDNSASDKEIDEDALSKNVYPTSEQEEFKNILFNIQCLCLSKKKVY